MFYLFLVSVIGKNHNIVTIELIVACMLSTNGAAKYDRTSVANIVHSLFIERVRELPFV